MSDKKDKIHAVKTLVITPLPIGADSQKEMTGVLVKHVDYGPSK